MSPPQTELEDAVTSSLKGKEWTAPGEPATGMRIFTVVVAMFMPHHSHFSTDLAPTVQ